MAPKTPADATAASRSLSVVILTFNEEKNLPACLASVADVTREVFVVDSGSSDSTAAIAERHGARLATHPFAGHAAQWNWAFANLPIATEWILALDADHRVTPELASELRSLLDGHGPSAEVAGYYVKRRQVFRGRWIRHGGYYPKYLLKLVRRGRVVSDETERLDFRLYVDGRTERLGHDLVEDNRNEADIGFFLAKHLRFASLQAQEEMERSGASSYRITPRFFGTPDQRTLYLKSFWYRLPLYLRPFLYFFYRYVLRLGFLDGKEGFLFHFLQGFWYRLVVDVKIDELRRAAKEARALEASRGGTHAVS
jgi:glycosyltransferase involved in cell wall biosynthesis